MDSPGSRPVMVSGRVGDIPSPRLRTDDGPATPQRPGPN